MKQKREWTYAELAPNSKKGCQVEGCKKYADYEARYGKKTGLFRFVFYLCVWHKLEQEQPAKRAPHAER